MNPTDETKDVRTALVEAFQAADSETAWYYDRAKDRVVSVKHGVVSDKLLRARDVEDDELRFVEVPALSEVEIHGWIDDFVAETDRADVAACLDRKAGANARFEERVAKKLPDVLPAWHRYRHGRVQETADAWIAGIRAEHVPGGEWLAEEDESP